eukprot:scaffold66003_cov17-Tisochrysis_lutea.AAC.2
MAASVGTALCFNGFQSRLKALVIAYTQALLANTRLPGPADQVSADVQHPGSFPSASAIEFPRPSWSLSTTTTTTSSQSSSSLVQSEAPETLGLGGSGSQGRNSHAEGLEEKRVSNAKMKRELLPELQYPSYREGMQEIVGGDLRPFDSIDLVNLGLC